MKITASETRQIEIEIEFPSFYHNGGGYYALLSEDKALSIFDNSISESTPIAVAQFCKNQITAGEFTSKLDSVIENFQSFKSQFFKQ